MSDLEINLKFKLRKQNKAATSISFTNNFKNSLVDSIERSNQTNSFISSNKAILLN